MQSSQLLQHAFVCLFALPNLNKHLACLTFASESRVEPQTEIETLINKHKKDREKCGWVCSDLRALVVDPVALLGFKKGSDNISEPQ